MKKLIAGNWKMNGTAQEAENLVQAIAKGIDPALLSQSELLVCPPFVHLQMIGKVLDKRIALGAQDCSVDENGAFTGDISAAMLKQLGVQYVILGHSERRTLRGETDETVARKAALAHKHGLITIICVGEKEDEREKGIEKDVVGRQLGASVPSSANSANTVIAYEPVWAIGTGKTAMPADVQDMHAFIRKKGGNLRILYGGSMKPENAGELLKTPNVDGGLIGGASLKADQFLSIAKS